MKFKALLATTVLCAVGVAAEAAVSPEHHKLCSEAKDYAGCVDAMTGKSASNRVITQQGADIAEGNQCPAGHAYIGGGNCKQVSCRYAGPNRGLWSGAIGHDPLIAGLRDSNGKAVWAYTKGGFWMGAGVMKLGEAVARTTQNPNCPAGVPKMGFNNTCQSIQISAEIEVDPFSLDDLEDLKAEPFKPESEES